MFVRRGGKLIKILHISHTIEKNPFLFLHAPSSLKSAAATAMDILIRDQVTESIIREYLESRGCEHTLNTLGPRSEEDTVSDKSLSLSLNPFPCNEIRTRYPGRKQKTIR